MSSVCDVDLFHLQQLSLELRDAGYRILDIMRIGAGQVIDT